ncbi:MAG: phosphoribosyltransferase family protein [Candidatus Binatia bacterium]|nr:phosphoribosyltransferase family protein [Candidatus Binatia bacterium]
MAIARFKYGRVVALAATLGELLLHSSPINPSQYDWVIPVPLTRDRLRWRGFNQALLLARFLAPANQIGPDVLERWKATAAQAELNRRDRQENVRDAFRVRPSWATKIRGASVLLIDDVMTTGATVHECSAALRRAGAENVDVVVLARVTLP